jgi:NAD+ kinase
MRALVVYKKSKYDLYSASPDAAVRDYVQGSDEHALRIRSSHQTHQRSLETVLHTLDAAGVEYDAVWRPDLKRAHGADIIITVGGDGTFLDASHYTRTTPMIGVNSDPSMSVGHFCCTDAAGFERALGRLDDLQRIQYSRLSVAIDDEVLHELALNEVFFAHNNPAALTRYGFTADGRHEEVKSSGLIMCAAAGSTGWMLNAGGEVMMPADRRIQYLHRDALRRPGFATAAEVMSHTREGMIYIDGEHITHPLSIGQRLSVTPDEPLTVLSVIPTQIYK